jgi:tetratricopeptide (TPR) repeat protein
LHAAHERGIIHRDLKPANVMIDRRGEPIIMDFGLACRRNLDDVNTLDRGAVVGTPAYMSPEQAVGRDATIASDQYSLGVILFELLTRQLPFDDESASFADKIAKPPPAPSELVPEIPDALDRICLTTLQKESEDRFQSLDHLACELTRFLVSGEIRSVDEQEAISDNDGLADEKPSIESRPSLPSKIPKSNQRELLAAIGVGVGITAILLAGFAVMRSRPFARVTTGPRLPVDELASLEPIEAKSADNDSQGDPVINTLLGRYFCFTEDNWEAGTRYLAKGADQTLKSLAEQEVAARRAEAASLGTEAKKLADAWRDLALQQTSQTARRGMNQRAEHWYKQAIETLSGSERARVSEWLSSHKTDAARKSPPDSAVAVEGNRLAQPTSAVETPASVAPPPTSEPLVAELPFPLSADLSPAGMQAEDLLLPLLADPPETVEPFAEQHLQSLEQIETQRRQMLAEMRELVKERDQNLPAQHVKATGEYAQLVRLGEELSSELRKLHQRHGQLLRRQSFSQDIRARATIQYHLDSVRPQRARAMLNYERLRAEALGKRQLLREIEQSMKSAHQRLVDLSQDAKQLLTKAFWSSEPTGTLSADGYDAMAVMFTSWQQESEIHPATLSLRALARCNQRSLELAFDDAQRAVLLDPSFSFPLAVQGYVKCQRGNSPEGIPEITRAIRLDGTQPYGYLLRCLAHRAAGHHEAALADASRVARLAEDIPWGHALMSLEQSAAPVSELRDAAVAVSAAELSCRLSEEPSWFCLDALAAAYGEAGRFDDAVAAQRRAVSIVPDRFRKDCTRRLALYQADEPFRLR